MQGAQPRGGGTLRLGKLATGITNLPAECSYAIKVLTGIARQNVDR